MVMMCMFYFSDVQNVEIFETGVHSGKRELKIEDGDEKLDRKRIKKQLETVAEHHDTKCEFVSQFPRCGHGRSSAIHDSNVSVIPFSISSTDGDISNTTSSFNI